MAGLGVEFGFLGSRVSAVSQNIVYAKLSIRGNSRSAVVIGCYGPILLGFFLCVWYAPSCTQRDASVMTQGTPKDDESFTRVIHSSFERDEGAWETLLSFTFRPLVCLSVCLAESTVILCWCMSWLVVQGLPLSSGTINPTPGLPQSLPHAWEPSNLTFGSKFSSSSSFQLL